MTNQQLDFVVFGPGRSGTTAFSLAFNCHPNVFCSVEYLPWKSDHSEFRMPDDMFRSHVAEMPHHVKSRERLKEKLSASEVHSYGNKMPSYYYRLDSLRDSLPDLKMFYIYRSPLEFVHSWDRRAQRENDKWNAGAQGVFGVLEQIYCLKRLASLPAPVTMVSYRSLFYEDSNLMPRVIERLGADPAAFDTEEFARDIFRGEEGGSSTELKSGKFYREFFKRFGFDLIDDYFAANPIAESDDPAFVQAVAEQFDQLPRPRGFVSFVQRLNTEAQAYVTPWAKQCRARIDNKEDPVSKWFLRYALASSRRMAEPAEEAATAKSE